MLGIGQTVRGTVEKLVFGGAGLIRHEGWVIFVPDVIAGEEVEVCLTEKKKSYFIANLVQIIKKSPLRIAPKCPYFGVCGGCQLQHLDYEEQLHVKKEWLEGSLEHMAKVQIAQKKPCVRGKEWSYRKKIILHVRNGLVGYFKRDGHSLLEVTSCDISSCKPAFFEELRQCISWFSGKESITADVAVLHDSKGMVSVRFSFESPLPDNAKAVYERVKTCFLDWREVWFEKTRTSSDETILEELIEGLIIFSSPRVFIQNYPEQSMRIYKDVLALVEGDEPLLDLYSGIGIFSLLAAKKGRKVLGVELNAEAVKLAKKSASFNAISQVEFLSSFAEDIDRIKGLSRYKTWVINPPRTGLSPKVIQIILKYKPSKLVYISCMPTTLARDVKALCDGGYELEDVCAYDMFPQTTHLETVASLKFKTQSSG